VNYRIRNSISAISATLVSIVLVFTVLNLSKWKSYGVLDHDMYFYYNYLPAKFIYKDMGLGYGYSLPEYYNAKIWCIQYEEGICLSKMTMGLTYLYAPFFFIAHLLAEPLGFPADGYSKIYHLIMALSPIFYGIIGVWLLRWLLLKWFSDKSTSLTLISIYLGTNLFFYLTVEGNMPHGYILFLSIVFMSLLWKWNHRPLKLTAFFIGIVLGTITLIRPVDLLFILMIPLWKVDSRKDLQFRLNYLWMKRIHVLIMIIGFLIPLIPQLLYWHGQSGQYVFYSYGEEGFFWTDSKIIDGFFSFRKGWLIYTPIMLFSIMGMFFLNRYKNEFKAALFLIIPLFVYVVFSWWCWWYGGSFGSRPMVDTYAMLAIPFATFVQTLEKRGVKFFVGGVAMSMLLICLNQFQTAQYRWGAIHHDSMNWATYKAIFGRVHYPDGYDQLVSTPDYEAAKKGDR